MIPEEEEEIIKKVAKKINEYGMETPAIMMLETIKHTVYFQGQMARLVLSPFLVIIGGDIARSGEKLFNVFEKKNNVEKLIVLIEDMVKKKKIDKLKNETKVAHLKE